jgi:hypothetical protein
LAEKWNTSDTNFVQYNKETGGVNMTNNMQETMKFANVEKEEKTEAAEILMSVYSSLKEKGYNPVNQIVGYILSGDAAGGPKRLYGEG